MIAPLRLHGFEIYEQILNADAQAALVEELRILTAQTPFFRPVTPGGRPMSVRITSLGKLGWNTDRKGYRYVRRHPNGKPWPAIPFSILKIWQRVTQLPYQPDCCLLNYYGEAVRMGLHQDKDEAFLDAPVVSISLGDEALFRMGGVTRKDKTKSITLRSGDVVVMGGSARLAFHGIDRIKCGTSPLLSKGGRLNLTLRVVNDPQTN